jgi:hypothetical protein
MVFGMDVFDFQWDRLEQSALFVLSFHEPNPHKVSVLINDKDAIAQAMWSWNADWAPQVT